MNITLNQLFALPYATAVALSITIVILAINSPNNADKYMSWTFGLSCAFGLWFWKKLSYGD